MDCHAAAPGDENSGIDGTDHTRRTFTTDSEVNTRRDDREVVLLRHGGAK